MKNSGDIISRSNKNHMTQYESSQMEGNVVGR